MRRQYHQVAFLDDRNKRVIRVKNRRIIVEKKVKTFHRKPKEEGVMRTTAIKVIEKGDMPAAEAIYLGFSENLWQWMRSRDIARAIGHPMNSTSAIISMMKNNGMLEITEKEPRKFYYRVPDDYKDLGRTGWGNMFREIQNALRKKSKAKAAKKRKVKVSPAPIAKKAKREADQLTGDKMIADRIHTMVKGLNEAVKKAITRGLSVSLIVGDCLYNVDVGKDVEMMEQVKGLTIKETIYREF